MGLGRGVIGRRRRIDHRSGRVVGRRAHQRGRCHHDARAMVLGGRSRADHGTDRSPHDGAITATDLAADPATRALATNPQMFPDAAMQQRLRVFGPLSPEEEARFDERFARISQA